MLSNIIELAKDTEDYHSGEIKRYNGKHKIKEENIAEHSFMLAMNIIKVCKILDISDNIRDQSVTMAILHDISEKYIGDVAYEFKSNNTHKQELADIFDNYENVLYNDIYNKSIGNIYHKLISNQNDISSRLVKLGDSMSCVQFSNREIMLGNKSLDMSTIYKRGLLRVEYDYNRLKEVL